MAAFRGFFSAPVWDHVLLLVAGMVLTPGKRTVSAALRPLAVPIPLRVIAIPGC